MRVSADHLADALDQVWLSYREEVHDGLSTAVKDTAGLCLRLLRQNSPKRTGAYSKGWAKKLSVKSRQPYAYVYNRDRPWLTHLLEDDHVKRGGGIVEGTHHIQAAADAAEQKFVSDVEDFLRGN